MSQQYSYPYPPASGEGYPQVRHRHGLYRTRAGVEAASLRDEHAPGAPDPADEREFLIAPREIETTLAMETLTAGPDPSTLHRFPPGFRTRTRRRVTTDTPRPQRRTTAPRSSPGSVQARRRHRTNHSNNNNRLTASSRTPTAATMPSTTPASLTSSHTRSDPARRHLRATAVTTTARLRLRKVKSRRKSPELRAGATATAACSSRRATVATSIASCVRWAWTASRCSRTTAVRAGAR